MVWRLIVLGRNSNENNTITKMLRLFSMCALKWSMGDQNVWRKFLRTMYLPYRQNIGDNWQAISCYHFVISIRWEIFGEIKTVSIKWRFLPLSGSAFNVKMWCSSPTPSHENQYVYSVWIDFAKYSFPYGLS